MVMTNGTERSQEQQNPEVREVIDLLKDEQTSTENHTHQLTGKINEILSKFDEDISEVEEECDTVSNYSSPLAQEIEVILDKQRKLKDLLVRLISHVEL